MQALARIAAAARRARNTIRTEAGLIAAGVEPQTDTKPAPAATFGKYAYSIEFDDCHIQYRPDGGYVIRYSGNAGGGIVHDEGFTPWAEFPPGETILDYELPDEVDRQLTHWAISDATLTYRIEGFRDEVTRPRRYELSDGRASVLLNAGADTEGC